MDSFAPNTVHTSDTSETAYRRARPMLIAALCFVFSAVLITLFTPAFDAHRQHKVLLSQIDYAVQLHQQHSDLYAISSTELVQLNQLYSALQSQQGSFFVYFKNGLVALASSKLLSIVLLPFILAFSLTILRLGPYRNLKFQVVLGVCSLCAPLMISLSFYQPTLLKSVFFNSHAIKLASPDHERNSELAVTEKKLLLFFNLPNIPKNKDQVQALWELYLVHQLASSQGKSEKLASSALASRNCVDDKELLDEFINQRAAVSDKDVIKAKIHYFKKLSLARQTFASTAFLEENVWLSLLFLLSLVWSGSILALVLRYRTNAL